LQEIFEAAALVLNESDDRELSRWIMSDLPLGEVHVIDATNYVLTTVAVIGVLGIVEGSDGSELQPAQWMLDNKDLILQLIEDLPGNHSLWRTLGVDQEVESATQVLINKVRLAMSAQVAENDRRWVEATIAPDAVVDLAKHLRDAWHEDRVGVAVLKALHAYSETSDERLGLATTSAFGFQRLYPKQWLGRTLCWYRICGRAPR
jgi:hypothetical protein